MKSENKAIFYQSKKEKITRVLVLSIFLLFFIGISIGTVTVLLSLFNSRTIADITSIIFLIFMSVLLLSPVVMSIYLLLMIYNQFKQDEVICEIDPNNIYVSEYAIWIRKTRTILKKTTIPIADIESVKTKKFLFETILTLEFTLEKYNTLKGRINSSLNRISATDKESLISKIKAIQSNNSNI